MVLHDGYNYFIARRHTFVGEAGSHQIDGLGGSPGEDNLVGRTGVEEMLNRLACLFMGFRCFLAQEMNSPVDIGIDIIITVFYLFDYTTWFLGCRRIIQINQWFAIDFMG